MALNKVILMGNMCADPELKQSVSGVSVCSFQIAVNRKYSKDGKNEVDYITIVAWRGQAEFVCRYFKKGQAIVVCGRLENREWQDKNGNKRISTEIIAEEISFAGGKESSTEAKSEPYVPSAYTQNSQNFEEIASKDADLPF